MSRGASRAAESAGPRRQARGQKRMAELLAAAGAVFEEVGFAAATTNAIAAKAGVSPGTLYQFFPNKQAMAEALAREYAARDEAVHEHAFAFDATAVSLRELIDRTLDPFLAFRQSAPGFDALFVGTVVSAELAQRVQALHDSLKKRLAGLILVRCPHLRREVVMRCAEVSVQIVKGLLPLALQGDARQRKAVVKEMKLVLERYLEPYAAGAPAAEPPATKQRGSRRKRS